MAAERERRGKGKSRGRKGSFFLEVSWVLSSFVVGSRILRKSQLPP